MAASLLKTASEIDRLARHPDWQVVAPSFPHVMTGFADRLFQESLHLNETRLRGLPAEISGFAAVTRSALTDPRQEGCYLYVTTSKGVVTCT